jgi:predicted transcriptional regulator
MPRLTITLTDERHRALKEAAARRHTSITALIDESLEAYGVKTRESAEALVARARAHAAMEDDAALALALDEVRKARG